MDSSTDSTQTLHDFVLNLLTNPDARSAFELDPEGALQAAGLSDITAADVRDVVPLVVDYAPVQGITSLIPITQEPVFSSFGSDPSAVIGQLQSVAQQFTFSAHSTSLDLNAAALGAISVDPAGLGAAASMLSGVGVAVSEDGLSADLSGVHDVAYTLDSDVIDPAVMDVTGAVGAADSLVADTTTGGILGTAASTVNTLTSGLGPATGVVDSLGVDETLGGVGDTLGGVSDTLSGVGETLGGAGLPVVNAPVLGDGDALAPVTGITRQVGDVLHGTATGSAGTDADVDTDASSGGGLLGLTDGLL